MPYKLSDEELEHFKQTFQEFDKDGSGKISSSELRAVLEAVGIRVTDEDVNEMIRVADKDGNGTLDLDEFLKKISECFDRNSITADVLKESFQNYDKSNDGKITIDEIKSVSKEMGFRYTDVQFEEIMKQVDTSGDGYINYEEFVNNLTTGCGLGCCS